ncbi:MAG: TM0106 family RecB-like putative nuclease [Propionibacteriaceae bacterium]|nr:TM0106 family RecB-like putative nuclease [Propionibacteriaceae bacterium]
MSWLDAYAARSCPLKTYRNNLPQATLTASSYTPLAGAQEFVAETLARLAAHSPATLDLRGTAFDQATESDTLTALRAGTPLVLGGVLPRLSHRVGRVPALVAADGGYRPVIVKYQRVAEAHQPPTGETPVEGPYLYSTLQLPAQPLAAEGFRFRWRQRPLLPVQLAHYWRMLEDCGAQAGGRPLAGVVGIDELLGPDPVVNWLPLDAPTLIDSATDRPASPLAVYDQEFANRLELAHLAAEGQPSGLRPVITRECQHCAWRPQCLAELPPDDLSARLEKTPLDRQEIGVLRQSGVATVADLAAVDIDAFLPGYLPRVAGRAGTEQRLRTAWRRSKLIAAGIELEALGDGPPDVPRAELEIDIDLETSLGDRVYLWGFLVNEGGRSAYHPFASFEHLDDDAEAELARQALSWLRDLVEGRQALLYHYSEYEVTRIKRLAKRTQDPVIDWGRELARDRFVDLFQLVRQHYFGAHGLGLKAVAVHGAGFHWRDDDPGGLNSMAWFEEAVAGPSQRIRDDAKRRILEYNEDDTRATLAVRRWLAGQAPPRPA